MAKIATVNAFLRGTGATFFAANLAALLAMRGERVALVDADLSSPTLHYLLGIDAAQVTATLNDFLLGQSSLAKAVIDVTDRLPSSAMGRLYFVPATEDIQRTTNTLLSEYDLSQFSDGFQTLTRELELDHLIVDTPAGTSKETLLTLALCDQLFVITTLDPREIKGSTVAIDLARELSVTQILALINKSEVSRDTTALRSQIQEVYECDVAAVLPYADDVAALASGGLFVCEMPDHPVTKNLDELAQSL